MTGLRVLLVTGGSRGIGAAVACLGGADGYAVAVNYRRDEDAAGRVVAAITAAGGTAAAIRGDVAVEADVTAMFAHVEQRLGPVYALVNSAGIEGNKGPVTAFDAQVLARLFAVNVVGTMLCCREAVSRMSTRRGGAGGAIVNLSSMAATIGGRAGASDYAASKAAVDAFTVGLAKEVAAQGIRVNAVRPGMTMTDMADDLRRHPERLADIAGTIPMRRIASAEEVARPVLWLLSEQASFVAGACVDVSGGGFIVGEPLGG